MGLFRWLWYCLFPPSAPAFPPENRETRALWREAKRLASTTRLTLYPGPWASTTVEELCFDQNIDPHRSLGEALTDLAENLALASGLYDLPSEADFDYALADMGEGLRFREMLRQKILLLRQPEYHEQLVKDFILDILSGLLSDLEMPPVERQGSNCFCMPLLSCVPDMGTTLECLLGRVYSDDIRRTPLFLSLRDRITDTLEALLPQQGTLKDTLRKKGLAPDEAVETFLRGTPFASVFNVSLPFAIPSAVRFEHMHIVAGSGHGKTQTLQHIILADLERAAREPFGFALIDSQGDLIHKITRLAAFDPENGPLADRLIIIDPNDLKYPAGLNLFDYNLERFKHFSELEQEKIFHGVLELYGYVFSSLLGAELTQKQGVVFTNLARAMMAIPNPTIYTFYDFVENGAPFRPYIEQLDGIPRRFFETQFFTNTYKQTRQQIITRLLGILGNPAFERMFAHPKNNIDMFGAMQAGNIVLVNTAKDLLKTEGSSILGRFFIALTTQATLARAAVPEHQRTPYHLYLDEAQEYFDYKTDELLNQGRKYRVGVTLAHQHLSQLDTGLKATLKASTSIKLAGGVNHADALALSHEMNCSAEFIQGMRKSEKHGHTEFACYIRHHTPQPVKLVVPFGSMERLPNMSAASYGQLIDANRARVAYAPGLPAPVEATTVHPESETPSKTPSSAKTNTPSPILGADGHIKPKDDLDFYIS